MQAFVQAIGQAVASLPDAEAKAIADTLAKAAASVSDDQVEAVQNKLRPPWPSTAPKPGSQQSKQDSARLLQIFSSLLIVAGVLAPATYQALYAASATDETDYVFRMLNGLSFVLSLVCVLSCLVALCCLLSVPVCEDDPPSKADNLRLTNSKCLLNKKGQDLLQVLYWISVSTFVASLILMLAVCCLGVFTLLGSKDFKAVHWVIRGVCLGVFVVCIGLVVWVLCIWKTFGDAKYYC